MKLNKQDFDLIKKCIAIVIDRKVDTYTSLLALENCSSEEQQILHEELKNLFILEKKLK